MQTEAQTNNVAINATSLWTGLLRLGAAAAVTLLMLADGPVPYAVSFVYPAAGAAALWGVFIMASRPESLPRRSALARLVPDALLVSVLVAGTGGGDSPFFFLYALAALEIVRMRAPAEVVTGAVALVGGYGAAAVASAGPEVLSTPAMLGRIGGLLLFCSLAGVLGARFVALRDRMVVVSSRLADQTQRAEKAEGVVHGLAPALQVSSIEGTLRWAAGAARVATGGSYAHAASLEGYRHHTICSGEFDACPTWWHPEIQRLLLWSCREGRTVRSEGKVDGMPSLLAVPVGPVVGEWWGALIVGGDDFGEAEERALSLVAQAAAAALGDVRDAPAGRDQVSGLPNHASLERVLARELTHGRAITLFIADVSPLRREVRGPFPNALDVLTRDLGERLAGARSRAFRYSRDEFAVIATGSSENRARRTAGNLRGLVGGGTRWSGGEEVAVGYAFPEAGDDDPQRLMQSAHRAVAEARRLGIGVSGPPASDEWPEDAAMVDTVRAIADTLEHRDPSIRGHLEAVAEIAREVGIRMALPGREMSALVTGALLHDVGKMGIPDRILQKTGSLTREEYETIKRHPALGARMLALIRGLAAAVPVVRHHHERFDGLGYPDGLRGHDIPLTARVVAVADAFDAMVRGRPYEEPVSRERALREIEANAGSQFDPEVVEVLRAIVLEDRRGRSVG